MKSRAKRVSNHPRARAPFRSWEEEYDYIRQEATNMGFMTNSDEYFVRPDNISATTQGLANFAVDELQRITGRPLELVEIIKLRMMLTYLTNYYFTLKLRDENVEKVFRAKVTWLQRQGGTIDEKELVYFDELVSPLYQGSDSGNKSKTFIEFRGAWGEDITYAYATSKFAIMEEERKKMEEVKRMADGAEQKQEVAKLIKRKRVRLEQSEADMERQQNTDKGEGEGASKTKKKKKKTVEVEEATEHNVPVCDTCQNVAKFVVDRFRLYGRRDAQLVEIINLTQTGVSFVLTLKLRVYENVERVYQSRVDLVRYLGRKKRDGMALRYTIEVVEPPSNRGSSKSDAQVEQEDHKMEEDKHEAAQVEQEGLRAIDIEQGR